jgi:uncharacterized protein
MMQPMLKFALTAIVSASSLIATAQTGLHSAQGMQLLSIGQHKVQVEIASTPSDRQQGLMFRTTMPSNQGMLFIFDESAGHCFWMRNTPLPLTIGFFDESGVLINTADMVPFNDDSHCPSKPAKYALEMNQGWFSKHHIKAGTKLTGLPKQ